MRVRRPGAEPEQSSDAGTAPPRAEEDEPPAGAEGDAAADSAADLDPATRRDAAADEGMATVWGAFAIAGVVALAGLVWLAGHVAVVRQQATNAADLAALAAAGRVDQGVSEACRFAETVTDRMRVELADCRVTHPDALVVVEADGGPWLVPFGPVTARARAGPVASPGEPPGRRAAVDCARRTVGTTCAAGGSAWKELSMGLRRVGCGQLTPRSPPRRTVRRPVAGADDRLSAFGATVVSMLTHRLRTSGCRAALSPGMQLAVK